MTATAPVSRPRLRVALQGFSEFERSALGSYFRLAGDRYPAYEQTESMVDADFIVADADQGSAVERVMAGGRVADTVFIGAQAPEGALAWMMRPIDPLHVLRELDTAVAMPAYSVSGPARRASDLPEPARSVSPQVLVVGADDDAGARALERQLQALGASVARANSSGQALELMARLAFRCVFVDLRLGPGSELDGLHLCQQIRRQAAPAGAAPALVLLSDGAEVDRVRARLAGCDACLLKPPDEGSLKRLLAAHGVRLARPLRSLQR